MKNGGELLDRLIKDIVTEQASTYISTQVTMPEDADYSEEEHPNNLRLTEKRLHAHTLSSQLSAGMTEREEIKAFSIERFVPLLAERIYVINPFTRTYLVSWLTVLDSIPELELVSYLPHFLDGLLKFLGDPTEDIRNATMHVLAEILKEIREAAEVARARNEARVNRRKKKAISGEGLPGKQSLSQSIRRQSIEPGDISVIVPSEQDVSVPKPESRRHSLERKERPSSAGPSSPMQGKDRERENNGLLDISEESLQGEEAHGLNGTTGSEDEVSPESEEDIEDDAEGEGAGRWVPGQGVHVDHAAIVEILLQHLSFPGGLRHS